LFGPLKHFPRSDVISTYPPNLKISLSFQHSGRILPTASPPTGHPCYWPLGIGRWMLPFAPLSDTLFWWFTLALIAILLRLRFYPLFPSAWIQDSHPGTSQIVQLNLACLLFLVFFSRLVAFLFQANWWPLPLGLFRAFC